MSKVLAIVGPESSGKTRLSKEIAQELRLPLLPEYARKFLEKKELYDLEDLDQIHQNHEAQIRSIVKKNKGGVVLDTDLWSIYIWSEIKFQKTSSMVSMSSRPNPEFYYLLCSPDLPYENDPLRENPSLRERRGIYQRFLKDLKNHQHFLGTVRGLEKDRLNNALNLIRSQISL